MTALAAQTATRRDEITVSWMVVAALRTTLVPASTCSTRSPIGILISRAAAVLRCAKPHTALATTAKPTDEMRKTLERFADAAVLVWLTQVRLLQAPQSPQQLKAAVDSGGKNG